MDGMGEFHAMTGSGQLPSASFPSYAPNGMLGRLNTPGGLGLRGLASSGMIQVGHHPNSNNSFNEFGKFQPAILPGNQNMNLLNGIPTSLDRNHLQQNKFISRPMEFTPLGDPTTFPLSSNGFSDNGGIIGNSTNSFMHPSNNQILLQGNSIQTQNQGSLGNQTSISLPSNNSEPFDIGTGVSAHIPDNGRCNDNWQDGVTLTGFSSNSLPLSNPFEASSGMRDNINSISSTMRNSPIDVSPSSAVSPSLHNVRRDSQCQGGAASINVHQDNLKASSFGSMNNRSSLNMDYGMRQNREENRRDYMHNSNHLFSSMNSPLPVHGSLSSFGQNMGQENAVPNRKMDSPLLSSNNPFSMQQNGFMGSSTDIIMRPKGDYQMDQTKSQSGFGNNSSGSLEDLMNAMIKREQQDIGMLMDGELGCNIYPVRTCM